MCVFCVLGSMGLVDRSVSTGPALEEVWGLGRFVPFVPSVFPMRAGFLPMSVLQAHAAWDEGGAVGSGAEAVVFLCPASQLNLNRPIEEQGPLDVIIHKLTDVILEADQNDSQSLELVHRFQVSEGGERKGLGTMLGISEAVAAVLLCRPLEWLCHCRDMGCGQTFPCQSLCLLGCELG